MFSFFIQPLNPKFVLIIFCANLRKISPYASHHLVSFPHGRFEKFFTDSPKHLLAKKTKPFP
jgi:hypothetical protein